LSALLWLGGTNDACTGSLFCDGQRISDFWFLCIS